ncbi:MAG: oligosaccharide flippase family protein [Armatimonadetes bacterium]|nr:oligosaccharide flippase family protein [Armatimonadota bacterium]
MSEPSQEKARIARGSGAFFTGSALAQAAGIARNLLVAGLLSPSQLGIWNVMVMIVGYGKYGDLGLTYGMNKWVPLLRSRGEEQRLRVVRDTTFWATIGIGCVECLLLIGLSRFLPAQYSTALAVAAVILVVQYVYFYLYLLLRADKRFGLLSFGITALSVLALCLTPPAILLSQDRMLGALVGWLVAYLLTTVYLLWRSGYRFAWGLNVPDIRQAVGYGAPLVVAALLGSVMLTVDRWVVAATLSAEQLGYYALGIMVSTGLALIPGSVANVLYPHMLERYGATGDYTAARGLVLTSMQALAAIMVVIEGAVVLAMPLLVRYVLPQYLPSILLTQILVCGSFFLAVASVPSNYLVSIDRQNSVVIWSIVTIAVAAAVDLLMVRLGYGVMGVAVGTAFAYLFHGVGLILYALWFALGRSSRVVWELLRVSVPWVLMVALAVGLTLFLTSGTTFGSCLLWTGVRLLLLGAGMLPVLWVTNRQTSLLTYVRSTLGGRA